MKRNFPRLLALGFLLLCVSLHAVPLAVGDAVPAIAANDQHGVAFQFTNGIRFLLVVTEILDCDADKRGAAVLRSARAV